MVLDKEKSSRTPSPAHSVVIHHVPRTQRPLRYVAMTRAKIRLFLSWRKTRIRHTQSWGEHNKRGSKGEITVVDSHPCRFLDDSPGIGTGRSGLFQHRGGGGRGRDPDVAGGDLAYEGGGKGAAGRGARTWSRGDVAAAQPQRGTPKDSLTKLSNNAPRQALARSSSGAGGTGGVYGSGHDAIGGVRYVPSNGGRAKLDTGYVGAGGRPNESESSRDQRSFKKRRHHQTENARYLATSLRDGRKRVAMDSGEGVDTPWPAKLFCAVLTAQESSPGGVVGTHVRCGLGHCQGGKLHTFEVTLTSRVSIENLHSLCSRYGVYESKGNNQWGQV